MNKKFLVIICLVLLVAGWTVDGQRVVRQQWEYRVVTSADKPDLNALGAEGWELVDVEASLGATYYFKRPK
jgi:hypothetical protein